MTVYDLTSRQAAALLGVDFKTLKKWAANGDVPAWRTPGGWWLFSTNQLLEWREGRATGVVS